MACFVRSLATTNAIESLISRTRHVKRNVKRWLIERLGFRAPAVVRRAFALTPAV